MGIFGLLAGVKELEPGEARQFMEEREARDYTLLDVRTANEYQKSRLPGAKWIPIAELGDRLNELDPAKPVIAYCAVGGRSASAAKLLDGQGFGEVYSMKGGIKKWNHEEASGPPELGLAHITGQENSAQLVALAHDLEDNLARFYHIMGERSTDHEVGELFAKLASWEEAHKSWLSRRYRDMEPNVSLEAMADGRAAGQTEGGFSVDSLVAHGVKSMQTVTGVLEAALTIEAQALDLYFRFSQAVADEDAKDLMLTLVQEEKNHLKVLSRLMEARV